MATQRKHGFNVPVAQWLRGPLRQWAAQLLDIKELAQSPWLNAPRIERMFAMHQSGKADYGYALWAILMFRLWDLHYG